MTACGCRMSRCAPILRSDGEIQASGLSFGMSISIKWNEVAHSKLWSDLDGIKVFFHERKDEPLTEVEGINVAPREDLSIAIRIKEFKSLNRKEHPCISKFHYSRSVCVNKCFNRNLHQLIKCRLPFMSEAIGNWCYPADIYSQAMKTFWEESKSNLELWAECGKVCPIECQKLIYTPYVESVVVAAEESIGKFKIYFPEMWYEIVEQKDSYDTIAFLCDVGGTFGLFLGCSVLTAVEIIEMFVLLVTRNRVASPPGRN
ncbi:unnamed protein product [Orchesella dallaii]|uniref:Sodium channel protein Nach n=1 Tax=Orchesella dallaii TaxID=48710 RepID=A0ABP1RDU5_9HEXA